MCDNWSRPGHGPSKSYRIATLEAERGWSIPALAVTAYARAEDRTRALSSGFQMHVAKPLEPADLVAAITRLLGTDRGAATVGRAPARSGEYWLEMVISILGSSSRRR